MLWISFCTNHSVSLDLPFARRRESTLRPPLVAILFLKPCSFERCLFFGWNVLSIVPPPFFADSNYITTKQGVSTYFSLSSYFFLKSLLLWNSGWQVMLTPSCQKTFMSTWDNITLECASELRSFGSCSNTRAAIGFVGAQIESAMSTSSVCNLGFSLPK